MSATLLFLASAPGLSAIVWVCAGLIGHQLPVVSPVSLSLSLSLHVLRLLVCGVMFNDLTRLLSHG